MNDKNIFEASLKELEEVVKKLESGDVTLSEMLELFEKGVNLTNQCTSAIDVAEQKINILMKNRESGELQPQPFAPLGE